MRSFCRKNPVHKIPRFRGGGVFWVLGGGGVPILFLWARGFFWKIGRPQNVVRKRGCIFLMLHLFAFVCACWRLHAFTCVLGPFSESLKSAFVCICARSFAFANIGKKLKGRLLKGSFNKACALTCRFLCLSPPPPPTPPPSPLPHFPLFSTGKPPPTTALNPTPNPSPRDTNRNSHPFAKTTAGKNYPLVAARKHPLLLHPFCGTPTKWPESGSKMILRVTWVTLGSLSGQSTQSRVIFESLSLFWALEVSSWKSLSQPSTWIAAMFCTL